MRTAAAFPVRRLLGGLLPPRFAGTGTDDALRAARRTVASGRLVSLEHRAAVPGDDAAELIRLIGLVDDAALGSACDLLVEVDRLGVAQARSVVAVATEAGLGVVLAGGPAQVGPLAGESSAAFLIPAAEPGAEERCRSLADRRVRLVSGRGTATGLAFVRCLNVLMAGTGRPAVATADERLIAITGERAAWYGRSPDTFEHVLPCGVREDEQQRLVAAGYRVRVAVPSGAGHAATAVYGRLLGGGAWAH